MRVYVCACMYALDGSGCRSDWKPERRNTSTRATTEHRNTSDQSRSDWMPERPPEPDAGRNTSTGATTTRGTRATTTRAAPNTSTGAGTQIKIKYTNAARSIGQQCKKVKKILRIKKKAVPLHHKPKHKKQWHADGI